MPWELVVIPGATHLFEEPGAIERVADHAAAWFELHLAEAATSTRADAVGAPLSDAAASDIGGLTSSVQRERP